MKPLVAGLSLAAASLAVVALPLEAAASAGDLGVGYGLPRVSTVVPTLR